MSRALFEKIAKAKASGGGTLINDGKYTFMVKKLIAENKFKGACFIAELFVVKSEDTFTGVEANKKGTSCSFVLNLDKNIAAAGNAKAFLLALDGRKESDVKDEEFIALLEEATNDDPTRGVVQPLRGALIADETFRKTVQSGPRAGQPFTGHNWSHIEQTGEELAKRRAELDAIEKAAPVAA